MFRGRLRPSVKAMTETWDSDPQLGSNYDVTLYQVPGTYVQYAGADTNGDGVQDTWAYDYNGDDCPDAFGFARNRSWRSG